MSASRRPSGTSLSPPIFHTLDVLAKAVGGIYLLLLLRLPTVYAARASRYSATPAQRIAFISLLIGEWKIIGACQLLSVAPSVCLLCYH